MDSLKKVTVTTEGYSIRNVQKAMLTKAIADFPQANDATLARMLGVSQPTIAKWCKQFGVNRNPILTKKVLAAIQLLKGKGFSIAGQVRGLPVDRPERRGGPAGRKKTYVPFETIEPGKHITVSNLSYLTVKNYGTKWLKEQADPTIRLRFAEDATGVQVFRIQ